MNIEAQNKTNGELADALRNAGIKLTPQRAEIYQAVFGWDDHPDAETVYRRVKDKMPSVSRDTVYRTLWLFRDLGLLGMVGPRRERVRFDGNPHRHHHFVCMQCGAIFDFDSDELGRITLPEEIDRFGTVSEAHVEVQGVCRNCLKNQ